MGQVIEVEATHMGTVAIFDTDRSLSGQVGESYGSALGARDGVTFPAKLAEQLFDHDATITNVYTYSNTISVARGEDWSAGDVDALRLVIRNFLVYYDENRAAAD